MIVLTMALLSDDLDMGSLWKASIVFACAISVSLMIKMYKRRTALNGLVCPPQIAAYHLLKAAAKTAL